MLPRRFFESIIKATIVTTYGKDASRFGEVETPMLCNAKFNIPIKPNKKAPNTSRPMRQLANTTSARAIQPRPAVMPSAQSGVTTNERYAPPRPAIAPPNMIEQYRTVKTFIPILLAVSGDSPTALRIKPACVP